jgi:hypothetical protein
VIVQELVDDYREATEALGYHTDMVTELQNRRVTALKAMQHRFKMSIEQISERTGLTAAELGLLLNDWPPAA